MLPYDSTCFWQILVQKKTDKLRAWQYTHSSSQSSHTLPHACPLYVVETYLIITALARQGNPRLAWLLIDFVSMGQSS